MNILSCKAQLLFSCLTACLSSCPSTCSPDYLHTYRAPFVQIKGAQGGGEILFPFTRINFEKALNFFTLCALKLSCLSPRRSTPCFPITPPGWPSSFLTKFYSCIARSLSMLFKSFASSGETFCWAHFFSIIMGEKNIDWYHSHVRLVDM